MIEPARPRTQRRRPPTYVLDAHTLYWFLHDPIHLSLPATVCLDAISAGEARGLVPAIVVAEIYFLTVKVGRAVPPRELFSALEARTGFSFSALDRRQLELLEDLTAIPEMHDRMIAAEARLHVAIVVSRDPIFRTSGAVPTLW